MEVILYFDKAAAVIIEYFNGDVTLAKVAEVFPHIWNHPDYSPSYNGIVDFRDCNLLFSHEDLHKLVKSVADNSQKMQGRAAVLVSEPISAAVGTMYSDQMKDIHSVAIFCSNSEVVNYLGVDSSIFEKLNDSKAVKVEIG